MRIIEIMPDFGLGGAETMCENLTYELKKRNNEVIVVSLYSNKTAITDRLRRNEIRVLFLGKKASLDISIIFKLIKVFNKYKPNVIHTHRYVMEYAIPAAVFTHIPIRIHTVHNIASKENEKAGRILNRLFFRFNKVVPVALSEIIQKTITEEYGISDKDIPIVYNGINFDNCIPKESYKRESKFKLLHIGRFSHQKNHMGLIKAFEMALRTDSELQLQLIGEGEEEETVRSYVNKHGMEKNVVFLGAQLNVYTFLNNADAFILPSLYEGMPMTLIEAMGTGLPIITTPVGGIPNMLENNTNCIFTDSDPESIANAIITLSKDEEKRKLIGRQAKERSIIFSSSAMCDNYLSIINQIKDNR